MATISSLCFRAGQGAFPAIFKWGTPIFVCACFTLPACAPSNEAKKVTCEAEFERFDNRHGAIEPGRAETLQSANNYCRSNVFQRLITSSLRISALPVPRIIQAADNTFEWPSLRRGLKQRIRDEETMRKLTKDAQEAVQSGDPAEVGKIMAALCDIAYGKGVTPQDRQDFLIKYGCAAFTDEVLSLIYKISVDRGIVEIGAGNGQWARALTDFFRKEVEQSGTSEQQRKWAKREFVLAYDTMEELPLNPAIYHSRTKPAHEHFYANVRKGDARMAFSSQNWESRGRVLLLVFPPPGEMALNTVQQFTNFNHNDTVIYVGEGRGGANANKEFFDFLESGEWALLHNVDLSNVSPSKGFERLFVLRRVFSSSGRHNGSPETDTNQVLKYKV